MTVANDNSRRIHGASQLRITSDGSPDGSRNPRKSHLPPSLRSAPVILVESGDFELRRLLAFMPRSSALVAIATAATPICIRAHIHTLSRAENVRFTITTRLTFRENGLSASTTARRYRTHRAACPHAPRGENPRYPVCVRADTRVYTCGKCTLSAVRDADSPALLKVSLFRWLGQHVVPYWPSARSVHPDNTRRFTNLPHSSATGWSKLCAPCSDELARVPPFRRPSANSSVALDFPVCFEGRNDPSVRRIILVRHFCTRFPSSTARFRGIASYFR